MYVNTSAKGRLIQGVARLGSLAIRGAQAAHHQRKAQQAQAMAVAQMASGEPDGDFVDLSGDGGDEPCTPCEEEQRRLEAEAAAFMRGR